jgi:hypothetical protein
MHIFTDGTSFRDRLEPEMASLLAGLRSDREQMVNLFYDSRGKNARFIRDVARKLGFHERDHILVIDWAVFDEYKKMIES